MTGMQRELLGLGLLAIMLVSACVWTGSVLSDQKRNAAFALDDLQTCQRLTRQLDQLRSRPIVAGAAQMPLRELTGNIEHAAREASVPPASLIRIHPGSTRRVNRGPYLQSPTQVLLRSVTLRQCLGMMHRICERQPALRVSQLRLSASRSDGDSQTWTADITLTYMIYSPDGD